MPKNSLVYHKFSLYSSTSGQVRLFPFTPVSWQFLEHLTGSNVKDCGLSNISKSVLMFAFRSILGSPTPIRQYHTLRFKTFPLYCHSLENNKHSQVLVMPLTCQSKGWFGFYAKKKKTAVIFGTKYIFFLLIYLLVLEVAHIPCQKGYKQRSY